MIISQKDLDSLSEAELDLKVMENLIPSIITADPGSNRYDQIVKLSPGLRMYFATFQVEGEVFNGGFHQYFWNTRGEFIDEAIAGYKLIGATEHARLVEQAAILAITELGQPGHRKLRGEGTLQAFHESEKTTNLRELDDEFYSLKENIATLRAAYVKAHPQEFVTS